MYLLAGYFSNIKKHSRGMSTSSYLYEVNEVRNRSFIAHLGLLHDIIEVRAKRLSATTPCLEI